jgi:hypothetical protein
VAEAYKRLGSVTANGTIGTGQTLYGPVPASTSAVVRSIIICNQAASSATYRLGYSTSTSYSTSDYLVYGATIAANDTVILTIGATLATTTYLLFSASAATVNAVAFGTEIT